jgi:hypothetical protein
MMLVFPLGLLLSFSADAIDPQYSGLAKGVGAFATLFGSLWWFSPILVGGILIFGAAVSAGEQDPNTRWAIGWLGVAFIFIGITFYTRQRREWRVTRWRGGPQATDHDEAEQAASDWFDVGG